MAYGSSQKWKKFFCINNIVKIIDRFSIAILLLIIIVTLTFQNSDNCDGSVMTAPVLINAPDSTSTTTTIIDHS